MLWGAPAGPIGMGIGLAVGLVGGAIAGLVGGIFGRGAAKEKAAAVEQQYEFAANAVYDNFKAYKTDYSSALAAMQALIVQGQKDEAASVPGQWGQKGAANLTMVIGNEITALNSLQNQRLANGSSMAGMPVPEFAVGGMVPGMSSGGMLAIVHPGEFVMQRSAVDAVGSSFLAALNSAPRFAAGGLVGGSFADGGRTSRGGSVTVNFNVDAVDGRSVANWFSDNQGEIVRVIRRAVMDGQL